jgi:adenylate cyclase
LLTSKEIIERTGISRATLNNYISSGLVPRPQVLPPGPQDGAAPRIGYFPDDTIARIEEIHRLKREGWSITRIAGHLAAHPPVAGAAAASARPAAAAAPAAPAQPLAPMDAATSPSLRLWLREARHPAYLLNDSFRIVWLNEEARVGSLSPLAHRPGGAEGSVFRHLLALDEAAGRDALVHLHLQAARQRKAAPTDLFAGLPQEQAERLEALYRDAQRAEPSLVSQARLPAGGGMPARLAYALQFREGIVFAYAPDGSALAAPAPAAIAQAPAAPVLTRVAVLVATLQDANGVAIKLSAREYFELLNDVCVELDRICRQHRGRAGRQEGEEVVWYFLPQAGSSHLRDALTAAQQTRQAMRQVSRRWQVRKSWDIELSMNIGIDEGQDWLGAIGAADPAPLRVMGDAAERAEQLSRSAPIGAILVTRSLLGKLSPDDWKRLTYGAPRGAASPARLLFTFARLQDIASSSSVPARFADVAVAELLDFPSSNPDPAANGAG